MSTVKEAEALVQRFSPEELAEFDDWYSELKADAWDRKFEADVAAGRLEWLAEEALAEKAAGRLTDR